jgi:ribulose 1,5-bisphosphate carboxylase large subunit-like protein
LEKAPPGFFLAQYYLETTADMRAAADKIASEETTGDWVGAGEPTELFRRCRGEVHRLDDTGSGRALATIAYPLINMPIDSCFIPSWWLFMTGGPLFERQFVDSVRLVDFALPEELLAQLPGPRFGMQGCRDVLGLGAEDLVIATIVKPCAGLTPSEAADKCREAALGGVDFIKDDEKMNNPDYCALAERARLVSQALREAEQETGRKVIYCPHISTRPDVIVDAARTAVDNGATGLMLNCFATGFSAIQILAERADLPVPIYVHSGGRTAWGRFPGYGVDLKVVARMVRMLGGDFMRAHMIGGYLIADTRERSAELVEVFREPMGGLRDMVPALSGGLGAHNLVQNLEAYGPDILPMAGGAILGHPLGIRAGVLALRQAAQAWRDGVEVGEYAKSHKELATALDRAKR